MDRHMSEDAQWRPSPRSAARVGPACGKVPREGASRPISCPSRLQSSQKAARPEASSSCRELVSFSVHLLERPSTCQGLATGKPARTVSSKMRGQRRAEGPRRRTRSVVGCDSRQSDMEVRNAGTRFNVGNVLD
jgi:hypothetical protein